MTSDFVSGNSSDIELSIVDFPPDDYTLTVSVQDIDGGTASELVEGLTLTGLFVIVTDNWS